MQGWNTSNFNYDKNIVNINYLAPFLRQTIQGIFYAAYTRIPEIDEVKSRGNVTVKDNMLWKQGQTRCIQLIESQTNFSGFGFNYVF